MVAGVLAAMALLTAGCGGDDGTARAIPSARGGGGASAAPAATSEPDPLAYSQCMREHGVPNFPDPVDGRLSIDGRKLGVDPEGSVFRAADAACQSLMPPRDASRPAPPEVREAGLKYSACMRENGLPGFPDPDSGGNLKIDGRALGVGPGDPAFERAEKACRYFLDDLPDGGPERSTDLQGS